jgi:hypothetical protein
LMQILTRKYGRLYGPKGNRIYEEDTCNGNKVSNQGSDESPDLRDDSDSASNNGSTTSDVDE